MYKLWDVMGFRIAVCTQGEGLLCSMMTHSADLGFDV